MSSKNVDKLSLLPDDIVSHILSLMPTTSAAVRTSTLSKRWRYSWTLSANLDFDVGHIQWVYRQLDIKRLLKIVNGVLELCKTSHQVKLFRIRSRRISVPNEVWSKWINEAVRLNVCELDIQAALIQLPPSVFICNTLTKLILTGINKGNLDVSNVPSNVKLPRLKTLEIYDSTKPTGSALRLIHSCPVLESLFLKLESGDDEEDYNFNIPTLKKLMLTTRISHSNSFNKVVLNLPNLEYFSVHWDLCSLFVMEDLSSLVKASISIYSHTSKHLMAELLKGISGVKSLSWYTLTIEVFLDAPLPKFPNLKHLDFSGFSFSSQWLQVIEILESFPELEHLCIYWPKECCWIKPQSVPSCMVSNLRTMVITECNGRKCDIEFLEYLLGNAKVLKKLTITCAGYIKDEMRLCAQLLKFPRASRSCEIHFVGRKVNSTEN